MPPSFTLSASILSADFACLKDQIQQAEAAGTDWIHIDVMDGHFVPNLTMGPFIVETVRRITSLPLDVHLMVSNPDVMIPWYASAGADWISVQVETCPNLHRTLQTIQQLGKKAGVVLNPGTPALFAAEVLSLADLVLVMSVNPGASGQKFIPSVVPKIRALAQGIREAQGNAVIEVDGGVVPQNLPLLYEAGARVFVAATAIFRHPEGISAGIDALRASLAG